MSKDKKNWELEDLEKISQNDDLKIAPFRADGQTYGTPTWIWSVSVDGNLYVRAYHGIKSRWYRSAMEHQAGRIYTAGQVWEVNFEPADERLNTKIDDAYQVKYKSSPYLGWMIGSGPKQATVMIVPKDQ